MAQEKQTSIRILQSKPVKKTFGKSTIFLLGLLAGIIFTSIFFLAFMNVNSNKNEEITSDNAQAEELHPQTPSSDEETTTNHDENTIAYKQHINDKDFNKIFKHEKKPIEQVTPTGSPFEQIIRPENKAATTVAKPPAPIAKPTTNQIKPKQESTATKTVAKESSVIQEEISPQGSVQMSIDRKVIEDKP